jgi:Tol biopolymer transport system component/C-terminal processing protease CtpA/Prc
MTRESGRLLPRILMAGAAAAALAGAAHAQGPSATTGRPSLAEPAISPDSKEIAFVSGGDIWTVPAAGGTAHLLISDPANEERPLYSPDGKSLAFTSTRDGAANIFILDFASGTIRRLTWSDSAEQLDGWSADGKWIYFSSPAQDVGRQNDIFRVAVAGGTPMTVTAEAFLNEYNAAPSPDGSEIAFMAKGSMPSVQWWRNGHAHIDESELWLKPIAAAGAYRRLLPADAKHLWPMWSRDGTSLWYMSDQSGAENIWRLKLGAGAAPEQVTHFKSGRVLFPKISADGRTIVFERNLTIWKLDTASAQAGEVAVALRGAPAAAGERHLTENRFDDMALSPDGKKIALIAHGQVFAVASKDGGPGERISHVAGAAKEIAWAPDSNRIVYGAQEGLQTRLMIYDFRSGQAKPLTAPAEITGLPAWSPDGKMIAYYRGKKELRVITLGADGSAAKDVVLYDKLREGFPQRASWSPDSQWLAFAVSDARSFRNIWVAPAAGGEARPISFLANGETSGQVAWSPDGRFVIFDSAQRSEDAHLVRVDLLPHVPKYREDEFKALFRTETPAPEPRTTPAEKPATPENPGETQEKATAAVKAAEPAKPAAPAKPAGPKVPPVHIVFEGIRERATFVPVGLPAEAPVISPNGKTLVFTAGVGGQQNLYSYSLDELAREPATPVQLTTSPRGKRFATFTPDSLSVYLLDGGVITTTLVENPRARQIQASAELNVSFDQEKQVVFDQAWETLNQRFFDPAFTGHDWTALRTEFEPFIEGARTGDELRRDINLMIGELNASHSGINPPQGAGGGSRIADLGLAFDREAYEAGKGLVVTKAVALGPAAIAGIKPGDALLAVGATRLGKADNLDRLLLDQAGKRTVLSVASPGGQPREVVIRPISSQAAAGLRYRDWVDGRRAYVEKVSNGRLGYVHLADMSSDALNQLYLDLDAQNEGREGVVIDVRNNNGGFVNGYVLDVFTRKNFLLMTPRDSTVIPSRQALGQRALGLPTVLVTNESSLSDSEDFTEGYRELHLGKVVGVPTAGWIIFTGGQPLIDGSVVRTPTSRIQAAATGENMEMHPRPVDVTVERPLGESQTGKDAQLDTAVATLLKDLPPRQRGADN